MGRRALGVLTTVLVSIGTLQVAFALEPTDRWVPMGPRPTLNGQAENVSPNNEVVGAVHTVAAHPTNADILFIGAVNGGVWRTTNATAASPTWTPLTDAQASLSIGALEFDPTDGTHNTLVAGVGRYSSFGGAGGPRIGLLRTIDAGDNWATIGGTLAGKNISGVAARGATLVVSVNVADSFTFGNIGIFRSTTTGASWTQISQGAGTGLPRGRCFDLVGDPSNTATLYAGCSDDADGIYRSVDTGATWTLVSDATMNALIGGTTNNIEIAVGASNNVYAAIMNNGQLAGIFRSGNGGAAFTAMDIPVTNEAGGVIVGIQPVAFPGSQGGTHFSIVADPTNSNVVYVGGDRQPGSLAIDGVSFPNSIGAQNFTGRLFRGDASQAAGSQWVHLTHSSALGPAGGGTASGSAPHADSREMVFDANGNIIEGDDGGVYRRTSPANDTGDWFSINGDLQITEFHDIAYDPVGKIVIGGTQDVGVQQQGLTGATSWNTVSQGDGGDVAVDGTSSPGNSIRYSSAQRLGSFRRRTYTAANAFVSSATPTLTVTGGGAALLTQFVTPVQLNAIDPTALIIGGGNSVYESFDQGNNIAEIGVGVVANLNAIAYGGRSGGIDDADVLYVGAASQVHIRTGGGALTASPMYAGGFVTGIVLDPDDWNTAYVIDSNQVFQTINAGGTWTDITGGLAEINLRSIEFIPSASGDSIVVGGNTGIWQMEIATPGVWVQFGVGLPNAPVYELQYDATEDILIAGFLGRGAWKLKANATDVYFLVDLSGSFTDDLPNFQANAPLAITSLLGVNPNTFFGLGRFEDYPIMPFGDVFFDDHAYERVVDLSGGDPFAPGGLVDVINGLATKSGVDLPQSQLTALCQAASGSGESFPSPYDVADIPAGQQANFRSAANKIIILYTDAAFHLPGDPGDIPYPGPSFADTVQCLADNGPIKVVGVYSGTDPQGLADVEAMALATGAIAGAGGVDCDADGTADVPAGSPLVCSILTTGVGIGEAIVGLVNALAQPIAVAGDPQTIECANPTGTPVQLDGSRSSNAVSMIWTGPFVPPAPLPPCPPFELPPGETPPETPDDGCAVAGPHPTVALPLGVNIVTLTVFDGEGGSHSDTVTITVADTTAPTLSAEDVTLECEGPNGTPATIPFTVSDACDPAPTVTSEELASYPSGETLVTFTATDASGNQGSDVATVTIEDTIPPEVSYNGISCLWAPNHDYVVLDRDDWTVTDDCDPDPLLEVTDAASSQPDDGTGDGSTVDDTVVFADHVCLRAERSGNDRAGRVYTVGVRVTDGGGNQVELSADISVAHDQKGDCRKVASADLVDDGDPTCEPLAAGGLALESTALAGCAQSSPNATLVLWALSLLWAVSRRRRAL